MGAGNGEEYSQMGGDSGRMGTEQRNGLKVEVGSFTDSDAQQGKQAPTQTPALKKMRLRKP